MNSFIDTNICIYAFDNSDVRKQEIALNLFKECPVVSSQVCIETVLVLRKKLKFSADICDNFLLNLLSITDFRAITSNMMRLGIDLKSKYGFSFLDSLIVSFAVLSDCNILYSEDMQHNLKVENRTTIINPFL